MDTVENTEVEENGTSERDGTGGPDATHYSSFRTEQIRSTIVPASVEGSLNSTSWHTERGDSMMLRQTQTQRIGSKQRAQPSINDASPDVDDGEHTGMRRGKRSIGGDGIWLKGSYPSKRARWEGPSMATPTPNPEHIGQRIQRAPVPIHSHLGNWDSTRHLSSPNPLSGFQSIPRKTPQSSNREGIDTSLAVTPLSGNFLINKQPLTLPGWTPDFQPLYSSMITQDQDMPSEPPARNQTRSNSRYNESESHGTFHQYQESPLKREESPNDSVAFFQQYKTPGSIAYPEDLQSTGRYTLPLSTMPTASRPRATRNTPHARHSFMTEVLPPLPPSVTMRKVTQPMIDEGNSFVTEVAASSQNLEEFQYRKRRPKKKKPKSQVFPSTHHEQQPILIGRQSLGIVESEGMDNGMSGLNAVDAISDLEGPEKDNIKTDIYQAGESEEQDGGIEGRPEEEYEEEENVLASYPVAHWYAQSSAKRSPSIEEDESSSESEESSHDVDVTESDNKVRKSSHSPPEDIVGHTSSESNSPIESYPKVVVSIPEEETPGNDRAPTSQIRSSRSPASQSLPKPERQIGSRKSSTQPDENAKVEASRCIYDFSTQSFNTTPQRSALPPLSQDSSVHFQTDKRESPQQEGDEENDEESDEEGVCGNTEQAHIEGSVVPSEEVLMSEFPKSVLQNSSNPDAMIQCHLSTSSNTSDSPSSEADAIGTPKSGSISSISKDEVKCIDNGATPEVAVTEQIPPKTPEPVSQVLPPEEQTPWAVASTAPIPVGISSEVKTINPVNTDFYSREESETFEPSALGDSSWQHIERPTTPENDEIRPFNDLMTPPPQPRTRSPDTSQREPQNTQDFIEAATKNPWETPKRKSCKSGKRVSFGIPEDNEEESEPVQSRNARRYSPPPLKPIELLEDETFPDGTIVTGFKKHFSAIRSAIRNSRRVILEDPITASSPSVGAMAEAFVTADREAPVEPSWETSRHLKPQKETITNVIRRDESEGFEDSIYNLDSPTRFKGNEFQTDFNMDDVLGEAAEFLGEWSVEADLRKARELKKTSQVEDDGAKRKRLFGIV